MDSNAHEPYPSDVMKATWPIVGYVASSKGHGMSYPIHKHPTMNVFGCECDAWKYRQTCRHVVEFEAVEKAKATADGHLEEGGQS
jgi:hypothetical protein